MAFRGMPSDARLTSDPATVASRIFIGSLGGLDLTKVQLVDKFSKFGNITACSLNRGFAFIQFETENSAIDAIKQENGSIYFGRKIEVKHARIPNRSGGPGGPDGGRNLDNGRPDSGRDRSPLDDRREWRDRERFENFPGPGGGQGDRGWPMDRSPMDGGPDSERDIRNSDLERGMPMDRERGPMDRGRGPMDMERGPMDMDRGRMDRDRASMDRGPMDRERGPMDRGHMDRERGLMDRDRGPMDRERGSMDRGPMDRERGPMDRGPMDRERGPMDRGPMDYDPMERGGFYGGDRNGKFPPSDSFRGGPAGFRPGMGESPRAGQPDYGSPVVNVATADRTNDCEIIVVNKSNREYAEYIERRLKQLGLTVDLLFPNEVVPIGHVLANISSRGSLYAIVILQQNEEHRSLTLNILHGLPEEHRNMPLEAAVSLISRNFEVYIRGEKGTSESGPGQVLVGAALPTADRHPEAIQVLLNLLSDNRQLTALQYDKVIRYLESRRQQQIKVELGDIKDIPPLMPTGTKQVELQHRIMNILNSAPPAPVAHAPPPVSVWHGEKNVPLLNDPTVQKALDSLIQGDLLRKISSQHRF